MLAPRKILENYLINSLGEIDHRGHRNLPSRSCSHLMPSCRRYRQCDVRPVDQSSSLVSLGARVLEVAPPCKATFERDRVRCEKSTCCRATGSCLLWPRGYRDRRRNDGYTSGCIREILHEDRRRVAESQRVIIAADATALR